MNVRAGVVTSLTAWTISLPLAAADPKGAAAGYVVVVLGSALPDMDHPGSTVGRYVPRWFQRLLGGHRMGAHSIFAIGAAWWLAGYLLDNTSVANAIAIGWAVHISLDLMTRGRVGLLYPLVKRKFRIGRMVTGSVAEDKFVTGMKVLHWMVAVAYVIIYSRGII